MYTKVPDGNWDSYKDIDNIILRNLDHFILFFLLGAVAMFISSSLDIYDKYVISAILISTFIEFIHLFLSYRGFESIDLLFNITGCLFGIFSLYYLRKKLWKNY
tara:strand:+ start:47 stop:358 length:312 start_codon:yes stop_codon:yes gene_type:complete